MAKYNFNEVEVLKPVDYGEYTTEKHQKLASAASQYASRHNWLDFCTRKDKHNNRLMLTLFKRGLKEKQMVLLAWEAIDKNYDYEDLCYCESMNDKREFAQDVWAYVSMARNKCISWFITEYRKYLPKQK